MPDSTNKATISLFSNKCTQDVIKMLCLQMISGQEAD